MRRMLLAVVAILAGCGEPADLALDEPIRIRGGSFHASELPGRPFDDGDASGPSITSIDSVNNQIQLGQAAKVLRGYASTDAVAVGVAFATLGSGYWVVPVGPADPTAGDEYTWTLDASIGWDLPLGAAALELVAIDDVGRAGRRSRLDVCVRPDLPDNANSCDATRAPPNTVVSLTWNTDVDLDLEVRTPEGKLVDTGHPSTVAHEPVTTADLRAEHVGVLDRDSNANCRIDGIARENLVWQTAPLPGTYLVYARLADACGQASVRFSAIVYRTEDAGDGTSHLVVSQRQDGELLRGAAGGAPLFLVQLDL